VGTVVRRADVDALPAIQRDAPVFFATAHRHGLSIRAPLFRHALIPVLEMFIPPVKDDDVSRSSGSMWDIAGSLAQSAWAK
jgi:hypothetical protein